MLNDMEEIQNQLQENLIEGLKQINGQKIYQILDDINENIFCSGVGGSMPTAIFASKVFQEKKKIITCAVELLELLQYKNKKTLILLFSHSGKNYGIKKVITHFPKTYLMTTRKTRVSSEILLNYQPIKQEKSFISMQNTLFPMYILAKYYQEEIPFPEKFSIKIPEFQTIEILKDYPSKTCASYIESVCIEANIAPVILHDKYSFCHGRTTTTHNQDNLIIYLISEKSELDETLLEILQNQKKKIIILNAETKDPIIADFKLTIQSLHLLIEIAKKQNIDLCNIKYAPFASQVYHNTLGDF